MVVTRGNGRRKREFINEYRVSHLQDVKNTCNLFHDNANTLNTAELCRLTNDKDGKFHYGFFTTIKKIVNLLFLHFKASLKYQNS